MKLKHCLAACLLLAALQFTPAALHAQGGFDFPDPDIDTSVPFDGGVSLLIAAGVAYGVKKKYDQHNDQNEAATK